MAELQNTFSWSHSRAVTFRECLRRYYWHYYGSWNGWRAVAPSEARLAYRLKQITHAAAWAGDITHRVIEGYLRAWRAGQRPAPEALREQARRWLNQEWAQSINKDWERDPKNNRNLFEHYYGAGISKEDRVTLRERVFTCVERFAVSPARARIVAAGPGQWLALENLEQFDLMGCPVWIKIDVAIREGEAVALFDWKSGQRGDDDAEQALTYALYAMKQWAVAPGQIEARFVYLRDGVEQVIRPEAAQLIEHREAIRLSIQNMRALLSGPDENTALPESFPMTDDRRKCLRCAFRELCFGTRGPIPDGPQ